VENVIPSTRTRDGDARAIEFSGNAGLHARVRTPVGGGPRIVFDCSQVRYLDGSGVEMMLYCLQEAMKRDGDLKLAALSPESQLVLELMREARVLQAFASSDEAVRSFQPASAERNAKRASSSVNVFPDSGAFNKAS
jgi:anti-anti-sigma regulatory factor